jgi:hypothetical protein
LIYILKPPKKSRYLFFFYYACMFECVRCRVIAHRCNIQAGKKKGRQPYLGLASMEFDEKRKQKSICFLFIICWNWLNFFFFCDWKEMHINHIGFVCGKKRCMFRFEIKLMCRVFFVGFFCTSKLHNTSEFLPPSWKTCNGIVKILSKYCTMHYLF